MSTYHQLLMKNHNPKFVAGYGQMSPAARLAMLSRPLPAFNTTTGERVQ